MNTDTVPYPSYPSVPSPSKVEVQRGGNRIPTVLWTPKDLPVRGLLVACHGGSGHKESNAILAIAERALPQGIAVLAIDGPVQGERRTDGNLDPVEARNSFRTAWRAGVGRTDIGDDFIAAVDEVLKDQVFNALPIAYIGVSMGTAYGLPLLAKEPRFCAAAIGLWSTTYAASEHLADYARQVQCPVWFTQQWNDEFFDRGATQDLFDAIGSADKRLVAYPGPHRELEGERVVDAIAFIARKMGLADAEGSL